MLFKFDTVAKQIVFERAAVNNQAPKIIIIANGISNMPNGRPYFFNLSP
jgi:hypothetical protein